MAYFPTGNYLPRTIQNRNGVTFDSAKTKVLFAEDLNYINDEIIAIENYLKNPQSGDVGTVLEVSGEELFGTLNGTNRVFSSGGVPLPGTLKIYYNGLRLRETIDYTLTDTNEYTFTFDLPADGQKPICDYKYIVNS